MFWPQKAHQHLLRRRYQNGTTDSKNFKCSTPQPCQEELVTKSIQSMKTYESKLIGGIDFKDYWNLRGHPLYIQLNKKQKPYFRFNEIPEEDYEMVNSLTAIRMVLDKHEWSGQDRYWKNIARSIQAAINIPYT